MYFFKKPLFILAVLFIIISCGGEDDSPTVNTDPVGTNGPTGQDEGTSTDDTQSVQLQLEGVTELDFNTMEVVTPNNSADLDENGQFDINVAEDGVDLPYLFIKNDELLFGYYRDTSESEITNEDILFYYFSTFPPIALKGVDEQLIKELLATSPYRPELESKMVENLNNEQYPFEDVGFSDLFILMTEEIFTASDVSNKSKDVVGEFSIDYTREGRITWPTKVPLYASIGVDVLDFQTGTVLQRSILEPLSNSPTQAIYDKLFPSNEEYQYTFQMENTVCVMCASVDFE